MVSVTHQLASLHTNISSTDLYDNPDRVVAFNTADRWAEDVSEDVARAIMRRIGLAGDELPDPLVDFLDEHLGPERQLVLWLA